MIKIDLKSFVKYLSSLILLSLTFSASAQNDEQKDYLELNAEPTVWHIGTFYSQKINLTMYFWHDLAGEDITGNDLGDTRMRREFRHPVRTFNNKLPVGDHHLKPMSMSFEGKKYTSNSLAVKVLPRINKFRGTKAYFAAKESTAGTSNQLVIYEYRDKKDELHDYDFAEQEQYKIWPHGGSTFERKDTNGEKVWVKMRYYTVDFKQAGNITVSSKHLKQEAQEQQFSVMMKVAKAK